MNCKTCKHGILLKDEYHPLGEPYCTFYPQWMEIRRTDHYCGQWGPKDEEPETFDDEHLSYDDLTQT